MQIVIDIPEEDYALTLTKIMMACYGNKVTELIKGRGRLIDTDEPCIDNTPCDKCQINEEEKEFMELLAKGEENDK